VTRCYRPLGCGRDLMPQPISYCGPSTVIEMKPVWFLWMRATVDGTGVQLMPTPETVPVAVASRLCPWKWAVKTKPGSWNCTLAWLLSRGPVASTVRSTWKFTNVLDPSLNTGTVPTTCAVVRSESTVKPRLRRDAPQRWGDRLEMSLLREGMRAGQELRPYQEPYWGGDRRSRGRHARSGDVDGRHGGLPPLRSTPIRKTDTPPAMVSGDEYGRAPRACQAPWGDTDGEGSGGHQGAVAQAGPRRQGGDGHPGWRLCAPPRTVSEQALTVMVSPSVSFQTYLIFSLYI
jgi:hypothetical protein